MNTLSSSRFRLHLSTTVRIHPSTCVFYAGSEWVDLHLFYADSLCPEVLRTLHSVCSARDLPIFWDHRPKVWLENDYTYLLIEEAYFESWDLFDFGHYQGLESVFVRNLHILLEFDKPSFHISFWKEVMRLPVCDGVLIVIVASWDLSAADIREFIILVSVPARSRHRALSFSLNCIELSLKVIMWLLIAGLATTEAFLGVKAASLSNYKILVHCLIYGWHASIHALNS